MNAQPVFRLIDGKPVMVWPQGEPLTTEQRAQFFDETLGTFDEEQINQYEIFDVGLSQSGSVFGGEITNIQPLEGEQECVSRK